MFGCSIASENPMRQQDYRFIAEIIDSGELSGYWHIDHFPDRSPLVIDVPSELSIGTNGLFKFGQPVEFVEELTQKNAVFFIQEVIEEADNVKRIKFSYPPEGIRGTAIFSEKSGQWHLQKVELTES